MSAPGMANNVVSGTATDASIGAATRVAGSTAHNPADTMSPEASPILLREDRHGVTTLCLNRPLQFNALSEAMLDALQRELASIANDPTVRCVVLAAAGKAFCAGHDLREMRGSPRLDYYQDLFSRCAGVG